LQFPKSPVRTDKLLWIAPNRKENSIAPYRKEIMELSPIPSGMCTITEQMHQWSLSCSMMQLHPIFSECKQF